MLWKYIGNWVLAFKNTFITGQWKLNFKSLRVSFLSEFDIKIFYKGDQIGLRRVDFFVENIIPVEIKALAQLTDTNLAQAKNYLEAGGIEIGLLINFGASSLQFKRLINSKVTV